MKLFAFAASLRNGSLNRQLVGLAAERFQAQGHEVDLAEFAEFDMPHYNADVQDSDGFPPGAQKLAERISRAEGTLIVSPEYNYSIPGGLKNAIDWLSRMNPVPVRGRPFMLMSASRSLIGGNRGLWQLRIPLECCGAWIDPDMFSLATAHVAYNEDGSLKDSALDERLNNTIANFAKMAVRINGG